MVLFDKRGTGLSDRTARAPAPEERMDDIRAVMDSAGLDTAVLLGMSEGAAIACLFAATYPERVRGLIAFGGLATHTWKPDYTWVPTLDERRVQIDADAATIHQHWGTLEAAAGFLHALAPTGRNDPELQHWVAQLQREGSSPGAVIALHRMNLDLDVRDALTRISAPVLVIHRIGDRMCSIEGGRYLAQNIPNAVLTELEGQDHLPWIGDADSVIDAISEFLLCSGDQRRKGLAAQSRVVAFMVIAPAGLSGPTTDPADVGVISEQLITMYQGRAHEAGGGNVLGCFEGPMAAIRCALEIRSRVTGSRIGIHAGESGFRVPSGHPLAQVVAENLAELAGAGEILVSPVVRDLVQGTGVTFSIRGTTRLDVLPGSREVYAIDGDIETMARPLPSVDTFA